MLATYPRDEVRGLVLMRRATLGAAPRLRVDVGADGGRAWALDSHVGNGRLLTRRHRSFACCPDVLVELVEELLAELPARLDASGFLFLEEIADQDDLRGIVRDRLESIDADLDA